MVRWRDGDARRASQLINILAVARSLTPLAPMRNAAPMEIALIKHFAGRRVLLSQNNTYFYDTG